MQGQNVCLHVAFSSNRINLICNMTTFRKKCFDLLTPHIRTVTYIRVTGNFNEIPFLNLSSFVWHITQVIRRNRYILSTRFAFIAVKNTQCNFFIVYLKLLTPYQTPKLKNYVNYERQGILVYEN